jgi:hypothetical protein
MLPYAPGARRLPAEPGTRDGPQGVGETTAVFFACTSPSAHGHRVGKEPPAS